MKEISIQIKKRLNSREFKLQKPTKKDLKGLIVESTLVSVYDGNKLLDKILYLSLPDSIKTKAILKACEQFHFAHTVRTNELKNLAKIIGYRQRTEIRNYYCSIALSALENPSAHEAMMKLGKYIANVFKQYLPDEYDHQMQSLKQKGREVLDDYIIEGTPFTSGIVNKNTALTYHRDKGNTPNSKACMLALKGEVSGGHLVFPELEIAFECANNSLIFMDGARWVHGVSNFQFASKFGYRYTIVFYTLMGMWECLPVGKELEFTRSDAKKSK